MTTNSVPLQLLVDTSVAVSGTRSRNKKKAALSACLQQLGSEVELGVAWLSGTMLQGRIGVGWSTVRAVKPAPADVGSLTLHQVDATLTSIKGMHGKGVKRRRLDALNELFAAATETEQRFLRHLLIGEVRQGALDGVMVEALADASGLPSADVRRAYMVAGNLPAIARAALHDRDVSNFRMEVFTAIRPMLAQTAETVEEALKKLDGEAIFDVKLDGVRVQVHRQGDAVEVYTRKLRRVTATVPEVVELARSLPVDRFILDGEVLAMRADGTPHTFQTTMKRVGAKAPPKGGLPLSTYFFDALLIGDDELIDVAAADRFARMEQLLPAETIVPRLRTSDPAVASAFYEDTLERGHEGVMAKSPTGSYEAGNRGKGWQKLKSTHTMDLVILAAEWGSGRRRGWLSNLHLGARDPDNGGFVMLGKTFKGLTDAMLTWQTTKLQEIETHRNEWQVFVRPEVVVEVTFNDVQRSPHYPGGVALRFARVKAHREDKAVDEIETIEAVRALLRD